MDCFVQIFVESLATAAACSMLLSVYLSVAWLPFREKMEERYHHHNQLKKLTHMGTKTKETPMHYQAAAALCAQCPPPPSHTGKVNHHHKNKDGLAKLQTLAWPTQLDAGGAIKGHDLPDLKDRSSNREILHQIDSQFRIGQLLSPHLTSQVTSVGSVNQTILNLFRSRVSFTNLTGQIIYCMRAIITCS